MGRRTVAVLAVLAAASLRALPARGDGLLEGWQDHVKLSLTSRLRGEFADWFEPAEANGGRSPFMLFVYDVREGRREKIPSACHTDGSARVQTVHADANPRFHALLQAFGRRTGVPVLVNTSFNTRGEPIVCTPRDAVECFWSTPLDGLVIGSFLLDKTGGRP